MIFVLFPVSQWSEDFPDYIVGSQEVLPSDRPSAGTFLRTTQDFIICAGKNFEGDPPPGALQIEWEGAKTGFGKWNNDIVSETLRAGPSHQTTLRLLVRKLEAGIKIDPQFFPFLYNAGKILMMLRLPRRAVIYFEKARALLPQYWWTHINLGRAYARAGDDQSAVDSYKTAARLNPGEIEPLIALGDYYQEQDASIQAKYYYEQVLARRPEYPDAKIGLARMYIRRDDRARAMALLQSIQTENFDGSERTDYNRSLHFYMAQLAGDFHDYTEAVRQFDRLLKHPEDPFFLEMPIEELRKRREIVHRLAETENTGLEEK